ncbi:MAG: MBL fold metallo-hydrolase [Thermoanaerobacteraceae bacterium]
MKIKKFITKYGENCYIVFDEYDHTAAIIDPGGNEEEILDFIKQTNLIVEYILLTHGHFDHIAAVETLRDVTEAKVLISYEDAPMLTNPELNLSSRFYKNIICSDADEYLKDQDIINLSNIKIKALSTPGHTKGGMCFITDSICFTGDTLFKGSIGRCDFPGGDINILMNSIKTKLLTLNDETLIYPGHGDLSTIGEEKNNNTFIKDLIL